MKYLLLLPVLLLLFINSCSDNSTAPEDKTIIPEWRAFSINQVYYDSLYIESENNIRIEDKYVEKIVLSFEDNGLFVPQDSIIPSYVPVGDNYYLNFQFSTKVPDSKLYLNFKIEYILNNEPKIEIDSTTLMLKYPYNNVEVFKTVDDLNANIGYFQDIDLNDTSLYFHPTGPEGLYEYNLDTEETNEIFRYLSGDFIAHDSNYVFLELEGYRLVRYNLTKDAIDLEFDLSSINYSNINGLECFQSYLYVIFHNSISDFIGKFDYSGNLISSIPYLEKTNFLTIKDEIAYSINYESLDRKISLYDLKNETRLDNKPLPTQDYEGIRIYKDKFYFVDWGRRVIGVLPLADLQ